MVKCQIFINWEKKWKSEGRVVMSLIWLVSWLTWFTNANSASLAAMQDQPCLQTVLPLSQNYYTGHWWHHHETLKQILTYTVGCLHSFYKLSMYVWVLFMIQDSISESRLVMEKICTLDFQLNCTYFWLWCLAKFLLVLLMGYWQEGLDCQNTDDKNHDIFCT